MYFREEMIAADEATADCDTSDESRKWYVRLRIRDDRLAKLWAWKLADHDVIVWSDAEERWKKLLAVPELRTAVRKATTSAFVRKNPPSQPPPESTTRRRMHSLAELDSEDLPTQVRSPVSVVWGRDGDSVSTASLQRMGSEPPARPVDPLLRALTTSIPPAVHSNPAPQIPRAPRIPSFIDVSPNGPVAPAISAPAGLLGSVPARRENSYFSIKNISWAMLPIACAGVFAVYLDKNPMFAEYGTIASPRSPSLSIGTAVLATTERAGDELTAMLGKTNVMCSGQPQLSEQPKVIFPEQLAAVPGASSKELGPHSRTVKSAVGIVARVASKTTDKNPPPAAIAPAGNASSPTDSNDFDKEGARTALKFAAARVRNCSNSGISGSALVTFAPGGTVQSVKLSDLVGDDVDPNCITRALSAIRVPPFTGKVVTVRKAF
jgi:hypothetical protein